MINSGQEQTSRFSMPADIKAAPEKHNHLSRIFRPLSAGHWPTAVHVSLLALFLIGAGWWIFLLRWGCQHQVFYKSGDWPMEYMYFSVLKSSLIAHHIPYFTSVKLQQLEPTDRFLAIPELVLMPQILLLPFLSIRNFALVNLLILYAVGFWGCLRLARRQGLSLWSFLILFALVNFNTYIAGHIVAGHPFYGYFLLPWFVQPVLELTKSDVTWQPVVEIAVVLTLIIMSGSCHLFVWGLMFLGLLFLFGGVSRAKVLAATFLTVLLAAFRIFPAAITFSTPTITTNYHSGFPFSRFFLETLISNEWWRGTVFPWEYTADITLPGLIFVLFFVFGLHLLRKHRAIAQNLRAVEWPAVVLILLAMGNLFYILVNLVPVPPLTSERVPSRFIILPLVFLIVVACVRAQRWYDLEIAGRAASRWIAVRLGLLAGAIGTTGLLVWHSQIWRIAFFERTDSTTVDWFALPAIVYHPDPIYLWTLYLSLMISTGTAAVLIWKSWRTYPRKLVQPHTC